MSTVLSDRHLLIYLIRFHLKLVIRLGVSCGQVGGLVSNRGFPDSKEFL